jgi:hypothetical protein
VEVRLLGFDCLWSYVLFAFQSMAGMVATVGLVPELVRACVFGKYFANIQIGTAIVRAIVWFILFHFGIDFWIFPNYFIDSVSIT